MKNSMIICFLFLFLSGKANTIPVGKGQLISSLKEAIKIAHENDSILLYPGLYKEGNIKIDKSLKLIGINEPVLDGENRYEILTLTGERILVKGIRFRNAGYSSMNDYAAINLVDSRFCIIENNIIERAYFAIHIANARDCLVTGNKIIGIPKTEQTTGNGIHLWKCERMVIRDNEITGHRDGIYFEFVTNSIIGGNHSYRNIRYGLHFMFSNNDSYIKNTFDDNGAGVAVMYSHHVLMLENMFEYNWGPNAYGILLKEISDATISNNTFSHNTVGILMESTNRIDAQMNNFDNNGWAIRIQASCDRNNIRFNNFMSNTFDVATNGTMMLNDFNGNYWDKYEGYDLNKDREGDVPYHPVSMYSMVVEQNPYALLLLRSFLITLLDKAEKAIPALTPPDLVDNNPSMKRLRND